MDLSAISGFLTDDNISTALITADDSCSYSSLGSKVNEIKQHMNRAGVEKGDPIAIWSRKSFDSVACILAVLQLEAVYVPIDITSPVARVEGILKDLKPKMVVLDNNLEDSNGSDQEMTALLNCRVYNSSTKCPEDSASILYTSGSTGVPKGVICSREGIMSFVSWAKKEFNLSTRDRLVSFAPFHFDLSVFDLFAGLLSGASIWLIDHKLSGNFRLIGEQLKEINPSIWYSTPTVYNMLFKYGDLTTTTTPRLVLFAGEVFPVPELNALRSSWNTTYYNLYGPTETNVCTFFKLPEAIESKYQIYPIGKPCPYAETAVAADGGLLVCGKSVFLGYLNDEKKTTDSFSERNDGKRWYKTGDKVRINDQGDIIYLGRIDRMIKRRGYRIEPAEIETALVSHESINLCAVTYESEEQKLKAFYMGDAVSGIKLKVFCSGLLPVYMIPDVFIRLEQMPLTSSGKIDYNLLKQPK